MPEPNELIVVAWRRRVKGRFVAIRLWVVMRNGGVNGQFFMTQCSNKESMAATPEFLLQNVQDIRATISAAHHVLKRYGTRIK